MLNKVCAISSIDQSLSTKLFFRVFNELPGEILSLLLPSDVLSAHIAIGIVSRDDVYSFLKVQYKSRLSEQQCQDLIVSKEESLEIQGMTREDPIFLKDFDFVRFLETTYHSLLPNLQRSFLDVRKYVFKLDPNKITKGLAYLHAAAAQISNTKLRKQFFDAIDVSLFLKLYNRENLDNSVELAVTCKKEQYIYGNQLTVKITIGQFNYYLVDDASKTIQGIGAFGVYDGNRRDIRDFSDGSFKVTSGSVTYKNQEPGAIFRQSGFFRWLNGNKFEICLTNGIIEFSEGPSIEVKIDQISFIRGSNSVSSFFYRNCNVAQITSSVLLKKNGTMDLSSFKLPTVVYINIQAIKYLKVSK